MIRSEWNRTDTWLGSTVLGRTDQVQWLCSRVFPSTVTYCYWALRAPTVCQGHSGHTVDPHMSTQSIC